MSDVYVDAPEINVYNINIVIVAIVLGIGFVTVSYHAVKAAITDPVRALRYE
ncbi:MAG: hypothetical protein PVG39_22190 [Desulfobacteraceae bacterium]|jgi:hypothetical protein